LEGVLRAASSSARNRRISLGCRLAISTQPLPKRWRSSRPAMRK